MAQRIFEDHEIGWVLNDDAGEGYDCKWYDWEDDLVKLSSHSELKDVEIFLRGIGEVSCDLWEARALNGKVEIKRPKVIFPKWEGRKMPKWNLEYVKEYKDQVESEKDLE